ncbi:MAG: M1 family metallopeptidase [Rhodothermia bacterium]|nr:M1 family metallopeptidase [Rhodothermia bacterium]
MPARTLVFAALSLIFVCFGAKSPQAAETRKATPTNLFAQAVQTTHAAPATQTTHAAPATQTTQAAQATRTTRPAWTDQVTRVTYPAHPTQTAPTTPSARNTQSRQADSIADPISRSDRRVAYHIDARLEPETKKVIGRQTLAWTNFGRTSVTELQFHLYLNGFRDDNSTYMKESGGQFRGMRGSPEARGAITVSSLTLEDVSTSAADAAAREYAGLQSNGFDLTDQIVFIQPDDDNVFDETVFSVRLPQPVGPKETAVLHFDFESTLPRVFARTGWEETASGNLFFLVGQWFPKIGVYEIPGQRYVPEEARAGRWNAHQFHANSEFYADFGTYHVRLDVPDEYMIGATGTRISEETRDGRKVVGFEAADVHDFAWTASPDFRVSTHPWRHVSVQVLMLPEHQRYRDRVVESAIIALDRMDAWVGPYPYQTLTIVDALGGAVGMEYPTFFTTWISGYSPAWVKLPIEDTVVHEFVHQYFYGILASNEFEEAWLDEGFTSYFESRIMDDAYGPGSSSRLAGIDIDVSDTHRLVYSKVDPGRGRIYGDSWEQSSGVYGRTAYYKSAVVLSTLENLIGSDEMLRVMQTYYDRWKFDHPTTRDFIEIVEEIAGEDMTWFFDQFVYGSAVVDYRVDRIRNRASEINDSTVVYESEIALERVGDAIFPQTVRAHFADGSTQDFTWDGTDEWYVVPVTGTSRISMAEVDPEEDVWLDINRLNNRLAVSPRSEFAREMQLTAISVLQHLFHLFTALL